MNVLVIGSGGREHALVWKIKQSSQVKNLYCIPGNAGIQEQAECLDIPQDKIVDWAIKNNIDLTVVGPEIPLVNGIVDQFEDKGLRIFGPSRKASRLEGSKAYMKNFFKKYSLPTAPYHIFVDKKTAWDFVQDHEYPLVIKTDCLAAGKGVFVCASKEEAEMALFLIFDKKTFSRFDNKVVVESFLEGEEVSVLAFCDGHRALLMPSSRDYKRIFDNDEGSQTGGVGAYSPHPFWDQSLSDEIHKSIFIPTLEAMKKEGCLYKGVLYAGLMLTQEGPKILEFNIRFGDPETQVILPRIQNDLIDILQCCLDGTLDQCVLNIDKRKSVAVVLTSQGYPQSFEKGKKIVFDPSLKDEKDLLIFHAGTTFLDDSTYQTSGGRVLALTSRGQTIAEARKKIYDNIGHICFDGKHYRTDIAFNCS